MTKKKAGSGKVPGKKQPPKKGVGSGSQKKPGGAELHKVIEKTVTVTREFVDVNTLPFVVVVYMKSGDTATLAFQTDKERQKYIDGVVLTDENVRDFLKVEK